MNIAASNPQILQNAALEQDLMQLFGATTAPTDSSAYRSSTTPTAAESAALQDLQANPLLGVYGAHRVSGS